MMEPADKVMQEATAPLPNRNIGDTTVSGLHRYWQDRALEAESQLAAANAEVEQLRSYVGDNMSRSDYQNADQLRAEVERLNKVIRKCPTSEGSGLMAVLVGVEPPDEREVYADQECAECYGTGIGSWGQVIAECDQLRAEMESLKAESEDNYQQGIKFGRLNP